VLEIQIKNKTAFQKSLEQLNTLYNPEWKCPTRYLEKANYHTQLYNCDVHSTREAFIYANALLATGDKQDLARAIQVLDHVARLQDKDPASPTYGIWSWYMEEPLEKMAPPDWNWADFCGKEILQVLIYHKKRIPPELTNYLTETLRCAALSIFRRNMHPGYTNISIMGSYVTLATGQLLGWEEMFKYGYSRFTKAWDYAMKNGTFAEYNSATYTVEAITDLSRIYAQVEDADIHQMSGDLLDMAWRTVAEHFHAPTKQWTGPNARSYTWLTTKATLSFLRNALDNGETLISDVDFEYSLQWPYVPIRCPDKYRNAFIKCVPHDVNIGFTTGASIRSPKDSIAIAHITQDYTLSSWAITSTWNQRRNLTGYWGGCEPRFINATILHDLYDFSSGMFVTAQKNGNALISASFYTDGGDTHIGLDMLKDETVIAYDLRMRIEFGGAISKAPVVTEREAILEDGNVLIRLTLIDAQFDGNTVHFSLSSTQDDIALQEKNTNPHRRFVGDEHRWYVDVIFYHGETRAIKLSDLRNAYAAVCVSMTGIVPVSTGVQISNGVLRAQAKIGDNMLTTYTPVSPVSRAVWSGQAEIDSVPLNRIYGLPEIDPGF
jgi:hypothetical protein